MLKRLITASIFLILLLVVSIFGSGVAEANNAPNTVGPIPAQTVKMGATLTMNLNTYFNDIDGDALTYTATSSDTAVATVGVSSTTLTVTPVAVGTATITLTGTDPGGLSATHDFSLTVTSANKAPTTVGTIPAQTLKVNEADITIDVSSYFSDPDGDTLTYTASSADTAKATVSVSSATVTISAVAEGTVTITVTATDPDGLNAAQEFSVTVNPANSTPTGSTIPHQNISANETVVIALSDYFSDPDGDTLTYTASSADTAKATVTVVNTNLVANPQAADVTVEITATATDPGGLSASVSFHITITSPIVNPPDDSSLDPSQADAIQGLSGEEQLLLGSLLTYDTLIFNELHNGSDDANDWLELRNVSRVDIPISNWQLMIQTGSNTTVIPFPAGTVISAGEVLLITNTQMTTAAVVVESFALPQADFALILRSPIVFGDIAGNYFQTENERPETAPEFSVDTAWERVEATTSGYRAEAWAASAHRNGLGSPGYQPSAVPGDLNHDGVVNILDLVLVASQFGTTGPSAADLNGDNTVNIQDLVLVANALDNAAAAPSAKQPAAALVNTWLQLARQNAANNVQTSLPKGFSYDRGIQVLEQLARALTPDTTALLANYPNPFNPETWIPYQLAKAADVTVTIYASDGNVVRTLVLGHQEAGMYKHRTQAAYWDGKNEIGESVASGLYFYTLTAGDFTATRRMLILK